jgi:hypothetical protein
MLIFGNPLGVREFDRVPTLIHPSASIPQTEPALQLAYRLRRSIPDDGAREFYCYRHRPDIPADWTVGDLVDPFPTPVRDARTQPRGRFKLPFRL